MQPIEASNEELTSFKLFDSFNVFFFSRNSNKIPLFLLYSEENKKLFQQINGNVGKDACVMWSICKKLIEKMRGILTIKNANELSQGSNLSKCCDNLILGCMEENWVPEKVFTPCCNEICKTLLETPYIYQDDSDNCVTYFVELPELDTNFLESILKAQGANIQFQYFSLNEISDLNNKFIDPSLADLINKNPKLNSYITKYIVNREKIETIAKYLILICQPGLKTLQYHTLLASVFKKHGEQWNFYIPSQGEYPTENDIRECKGIIIPGSTVDLSIPEIPDWLEKVIHLLLYAYNECPQVNLLGLCFGGQLFCHMLGGKVEKMNCEFIRRGEIIDLKPEFFELPYVKNLGLNPSEPLVIAEAHQNEMSRLPPGAKLLGTSKSCCCEIFSVGDRILGFQGHPEYNERFQAGAQYRAKRPDLSNGWAKFEEDFCKEAYEKPLTQYNLLKVCYAFLKKDNVA